MNDETKKAILVWAIFVPSVLFGGLVTMKLWNWLATAIFQVSPVTFTQALALGILLDWADCGTSIPRKINFAEFVEWVLAKYLFRPLIALVMGAIFKALL